MNIVEQSIVAAARELVNDYLEWCAADANFDAGEFSERADRTVPPEVMAASELLDLIDHPEDQDDFWTSDEAKYPDGC